MKGIPSSFGYENTFAFMHTSKTAFTFARSLSRLRKRQHSRQKGQNYSSACMKYFTLSITVREKYKVCRRRLPWRRHVQGHRYVVMIEKYRLTIVPFSLVHGNWLMGRESTKQCGNVGGQGAEITIVEQICMPSKALNTLKSKLRLYASYQNSTYKGPLTSWLTALRRYIRK